ncbi:hypothetical protein C8J56DRAFT_801640 [Mycena floridula]|nr:hypothetical protein C8J56DRAFT_801640 [Mycena floridula]
MGESWTANYKGLNAGTGSYELSDAIWEGIGHATAAAGSTIPSAYGTCVPNIADSNFMFAEMYSIWTLYIGLVLLRRCFTDEKYYKHFIDLVYLLNICLQFEITKDEVELVRLGFIKWVEQYEEFYYQHDPTHISTCPLTIHGQLHITSSILIAGPVWCYWAFPMERYCGVTRGKTRRCHPFASLDRFVIEDSQLTQIKTVYDKVEALSLKPPPAKPSLMFQDPAYPTCRLLPPRASERPDASTLKPLIGALATRFNVSVNIVRMALKDSIIEEWGRDVIHSSGLGTIQEDSRDATYYEMLVDRNARKRHAVPDFQPETFYGQLQHIYLVKFTEPCASLALTGHTAIIIAAMCSCKLDKSIDIPKLDFHFYSGEGQMHVVDITSIQALIGRVKDRDNIWALVDHSGALAWATFNLDAE